jgi:two-component system, LytTR family, sensor kinase
MFTDQPLKKLFIFALLTSPLFGLFGSTPGFTMKEFEMERTIRIFLFVTGSTFIFWLINIFLLWGNSYFFLLRHKTLRFFIGAIICGAIIFLIFLLIEPSMKPPGEMPAINFPVHPRPRMVFFPIMQAMSINFIIFILIELILLKETKNKVAIENEKLKLANLEAKNSQLQQQLHPHFLFNSLTTLRSLISRSPEQAQDYLEKLSDLLRFSTNNSQQALVLLQEEVELCTNYLNMQKVRFGNALNFNINIPWNLQQACKVPVYSLQQLAENAIKHNILTRELPLLIEINIEDNGEWILVRNNLQPKAVKEESIGVGLANLSERYRLVANEDIIIKKETGYFSVCIKILCNESNNN